MGGGAPLAPPLIDYQVYMNKDQKKQKKKKLLLVGSPSCLNSCSLFFAFFLVGFGLRGSVSHHRQPFITPLAHNPLPCKLNKAIHPHICLWLRTSASTALLVGPPSLAMRYAPVSSRLILSRLVRLQSMTYHLFFPHTEQNTLALMRTR